METKNCKLKAGYSKESIVPEFAVSLSGYGEEDTRIWEKVLEEIFLTCIAVCDHKRTILIYTLDTLGIMQEHAEVFRCAVSAETGVPTDCIFFSATHTHNAPSMYPICIPSTQEYVAFVTNIAVTAAKKAISDLSPATLFLAKKEINGMNFTRHYVDSKGNKYSIHMGVPHDADLISHVGENDPSLSLLRFKRLEKKDIVFINWQAHPDFAHNIGFYYISPSWVGKFRSTLEKETGVLSAYFTGAAGNLSAESLIKSEKHNLRWFEYGEALGKIAAETLNEEIEINFDEIKTCRRRYKASIDHSKDNIKNIAQQIIDLYGNGKINEAIELRKKHDIFSLIHADAVLFRSTLPEEVELELNAFRIGDAAFLSTSCEMFSEQGLYIKRNSPFSTCFVLSGGRTYLAPEEAYDFGAYEATGHSSFYTRGTAEKVADIFVEMLQQL